MGHGPATAEDAGPDGPDGSAGPEGSGRDARRTRLLRGVLDVCLLAVISSRPRYGYELVRELEAHGMELVSEGSIYPLLARLSRAGLLETYRQEKTAGGPPRKYYRLTAAGAEALAQGTAEWRAFARSADSVLGTQREGAS